MLEYSQNAFWNIYLKTLYIMFFMFPLLLILSDIKDIDIKVLFYEC